MSGKESVNSERVSLPWLMGLGALCLLGVFGEAFYEKHPHVEYESWFAFYALSAIAATIVLLAVAFLLRFLVAKEGDYYGE